MFWGDEGVCSQRPFCVYFSLILAKLMLVFFVFVEVYLCFFSSMSITLLVEQNVFH